MMAYRFAQEKTDRLAALAVVAGALNSTTSETKNQWNPPSPSGPLTVLIMHGANDRAVPVHGGESPAKGDGRLYTSMQDAADFWIKNNDGSAPVKTVELPEWGHNWPGPFFTVADSTAPSMKNYDAAEVIWTFFENATDRSE
jgi:poly(3-hydroxybutyrate) depolymerase